MTDAAGPTEQTEYTLWATFARETDPPGGDGGDLERAIGEIADTGVRTRGLYDVSGLKADADVMIWLHGPDLAAIQAGLRTLRRTSTLASSTPVWHAAGVHRDAEFNRSHVPAFMRGLEPKGWLCVYPFVRSYEWYLLPEEERRTMLADHGRKGAAHRGVLTNTVAAFALGDYEWILPLEADDPMELVDLMRDLRYTEARRHVREEVPFYTGRRVSPQELVEVLR
ncbi:hydrogen peroxide-dependent heme synthase [Pseudactinotalea sp.]|uniref:hydrogen peroxide-dependent heme synthase n=1 Tax=Pseudactinotalea sp. TaxID=1926260 RepID=UPI003B3B8115